MRQMKEMSLTLLPRKAELLCQILHYKGLAFLKMKNYDQAIETFSVELELAANNKMLDIKGRAIDYLGRTYASKQAWAEAAEVWETRLPISKTPLERSYIFHEIGRCYLELSKLDIARYYATNAFDEAVKIEDWIWAMNAKILLGQIERKSSSALRCIVHLLSRHNWTLNFSFSLVVFGPNFSQS